MILAFIIFLPLLAFLTNGLCLKTQAKASLAGGISFAATFLSFLLVLTTYGNVVQFQLWDWVQTADFTLSVSFLMDPLSFTLACMVTGIGSMITLFSIGYMGKDPRVGKYFSYLSLFIFFMLLLTLSSNMVVLFFGWEGVGLCSYLLIGFWYQDKEKAAAGKKAFITNRIGDMGVILGILGYAFVFKTLNFSEFQSIDPAVILENKEFLTLSSLFLVLGVTGKSAQLPLYVWLPDAMAGPTPVSALIHAATMVTAGIFLLCRLSFVLVQLPVVMTVIAWIGALTALLAALIALTQSDIKKVLAYSTVSQLGYMMMACGVGAFRSGMFHVFTHGFFKALLFLGAGSIIHSLHHEQNLWKMGGLRKKLPVTFWTVLIGALSLAGLPFLAGFFSKDEILWLTLNQPQHGKILYGMAAVTALLTAFYTMRLVSLAFFAKDKTSSAHPIKESSWVMKLPLIVLALMSAFAGYLGLPHFLSHHHSRGFQNFLSSSVAERVTVTFSEHTEHLLMISLSALILLLLGLAYYIYVKGELQQKPKKLKENFLGLWSLSSQKFRVDEFYQWAFIKPLHKKAQFLDKYVEDLGINRLVLGIAHFFIRVSWFFKKVSGQSLSSALLWMIGGMALIVSFTLGFLL